HTRLFRSHTHTHTRAHTHTHTQPHNLPKCPHTSPEQRLLCLLGSTCPHSHHNPNTHTTPTHTLTQPQHTLTQPQHTLTHTQPQHTQPKHSLTHNPNTYSLTSVPALTLTHSH